MRRQIALLLVAVVTVSGLVVPAASGAVRLKSSRVYFTCVQNVPPQNIPATLGRYPTWTTKKPNASFRAGGGCGHLEGMASTGALRNSLDAVFVGRYKGPLDSITVELHNIYVGSGRASGEMTVEVRLEVDKREVLLTDGDPGVEVTVEPVRSSTGLSEMIRFTITGIGALQNKNHTVALNIGSTSEQQSIWVWNAVEIPSGLTFNPGRAETVKIPAA